MFIGYVENSVAYKFLVLKSDMLDCNTVIKIKNIEFFEHIYPLNERFLMHMLMIIELMKLILRSREQIKETSFKKYFLLILEKQLKLKLIHFCKIKLGRLLICPQV
jgi:hypothetical protein